MSNLVIELDDKVEAGFILALKGDEEFWVVHGRGKSVIKTTNPSNFQICELDFALRILIV